MTLETAQRIASAIALIGIGVAIGAALVVLTWTPPKERIYAPAPAMQAAP